MSQTILITSGRSPAGLDLTRNFAKHGHRVLIAESFPVHLCQFSRFGKSFKVPAPAQDPQGYIQKIQQIVSRESVDLIIPVYEEIFPLSFFREQIDCRILCDEFGKLKRLHNKFEFIEACRDAGVSHPETALVRSAGEVVAPGSKILKPQFSRFGTGVYLRPSEKTLNSLDYSTPWVMQDFVDGQAYCGFCIAQDGEVLLDAVYPFEVTWSGVCVTYRHVAEKNIQTWMAEFIRHARFTGSIGFDIILKDETVFPIECNPRITSGIHLFSGEEGLVDAILNHTRHSDPLRRECMMGPFVMAKAMLNWSLWKKWFSLRDLIFRWSDPFPLLGQGVVMSYLSWLALRKGKPMSEAASLDIEYNGEEY